MMLSFIVFLIIFQWTNIPILNWTPGLVSVMVIVIAFNSYVQSSVQSVNKKIAYGLALRLRSHLIDKSDETFCLLVPLVALKQENYPLKQSVLYEIEKNVFKPEKLVEYYYFN
jgi:hypothetical protein